MSLGSGTKSVGKSGYHLSAHNPLSCNTLYTEMSSVSRNSFTTYTHVHALCRLTALSSVLASYASKLRAADSGACLERGRTGARPLNCAKA